jgi:putative two-component system response regulator
LELGANDFLSKPMNFTEVRLRVANLLETRRLHLALKDQNDALERRVRERTRSLEQARLEVLDRLSLAAEYRDDITNEHSRRVGRTAALLARELDVSTDEVDLIYRAAALHDIGKIGIPDAILLKPGRLTQAELRLMQSHVEIGAKILDGSASPLLRLGQQIAVTHHERWDGTGYPAGLTGGQIPLVGRLVALADVFDAITHRRPYKEAVPLQLALAEIRALNGTHFEPRVVEAFETLDKEALLAPIEEHEPVSPR